MKKNPLNKGILTENFKEVGPVNPDMLRKRACELALIAGRTATLIDFDQARRELSGESEMDAQQELLESLPEDGQWTVPGSTGKQAHDSAMEDEDEDGRSESAQLFEEGVKEAEHDQMLQAALRADNRDL